MVQFADLYKLPTLSQAKATVLSIAGSVGLKARTWIFGDPSERWIEISARVIDGFTSTITVQAIRGFFLDLATDPGDPGDLSPDQTPRPGWLSGLGEGWYGVIRRGRTYATTTITIMNTGTAATSPFKPGDLTFTLGPSAPVRSDGGKPTYRNTEDGGIYDGIDGSKTLAPGASVTIPIKCQQLGSYGSAPSGTSTGIGICITQSFGALTVTSANSARGEEREDPDLYRARCRLWQDAIAHGSPETKYRVCATTGLDRAPLQRWDGSGVVGITRTYVYRDMAGTGNVTCYFADADGPADTVDVESANANIQGVEKGVIVDPIGAVGDCTTYVGIAATPHTIAVAGSCKVKSQRGGLSGAELQDAVKAAIVEAYAVYQATFDIGGLDQVDGAGFVYTNDLECVARDSYAGVYAVTLSSPSGSSTALARGECVMFDTDTSDWTVTVTT